MAADREYLIYALDTCDEVRTEAVRGMISLAIAEMEVCCFVFILLICTVPLPLYTIHSLF